MNIFIFFLKSLKQRYNFKHASKLYYIHVCCQYKSCHLITPISINNKANKMSATAELHQALLCSLSTIISLDPISIPRVSSGSWEYAGSSKILFLDKTKRKVHTLTLVLYLEEENNMTVMSFILDDNVKTVKANTLLKETILVLVS